MLLAVFGLWIFVDITEVGFLRGPQKSKGSKG